MSSDEKAPAPLKGAQYPYLVKAVQSACDNSLTPEWEHATSPEMLLVFVCCPAAAFIASTGLVVPSCGGENQRRPSSQSHRSKRSTKGQFMMQPHGLRHPEGTTFAKLESCVPKSSAADMAATSHRRLASEELTETTMACPKRKESAIDNDDIVSVITSTFSQLQTLRILAEVAVRRNDETQERSKCLSVLWTCSDLNVFLDPGAVLLEMDFFTHGVSPIQRLTFKLACEVRLS